MVLCPRARVSASERARQWGRLRRNQPHTGYLVINPHGSSVSLKARRPSATMPRLSPVQHWLSMLLCAPCVGLRFTLMLLGCAISRSQGSQLLERDHVHSHLLLFSPSCRHPGDTQQFLWWLHTRQLASSTCGGCLSPPPPLLLVLLCPHPPSPLHQALPPRLMPQPVQQSTKVNIQDVGRFPAPGQHTRPSSGATPAVSPAPGS